MTPWKKLLTGCALAGMISLASPVLADTLTYTASLTGAGETPPNQSTATGMATFLLTGNVLEINVTFSGLTGGPAAAAHIHCCAAQGTNAAVWVPFAGFPNATSGTYTATVDLSTFAFSGGGTEAALIAGMNNGTAYTNIHDAEFPGGEIRGQITPTPEPGTLLLLGTGAAGIAYLVRRRIHPEHP